MTSLPYNSLANCIASLRESVNLLDDSLNILNQTTQDIPRIKNVLLTKRVFGLIPESDLNNAKQNFQIEVEPQVNSLMSRIDKSLQVLHRKHTKLQNRYELQSVRLSSSKRDSLGDVPLSRISKAKNVDEKKLARLQILRIKKERLKYTLTTLNLQERTARLNVPSLRHPENI
ncbi:DASH complex subunit Spc19 [Scheffersomyces xylosifermentans]|uniref:DASH complex subunit Spc19 n=1 Tax=Scheffersomyces xylosifermentans TaxID=1304137 RepID=UPI00315CFF14